MLRRIRACRERNLLRGIPCVSEEESTDLLRVQICLGNDWQSPVLLGVVGGRQSRTGRVGGSGATVGYSIPSRSTVFDSTVT